MDALAQPVVCKKHILKAFVKKHRHCAPQGSQEWHHQRRSIIGGSEIAIVTGDSPYQTIADLVRTKTGLKSFSGNLATQWGHLFEYLHVIILKSLLGLSSVYSTGSIPGAIPHHRFSPDGLAIVQFKKQNCIALLEFKSPLRSIPEGVVPVHYRPQVLAGLEDISICDFGLFSNALFRLCTIDQFEDNGRYWHQFHSSDATKKFVSGKPLAMGIISVFRTEEQKKQYEKHVSADLLKSFLVDYCVDESKNETTVETFQQWMTQRDEVKEDCIVDFMHGLNNIQKAECFFEELLRAIRSGWLSVKYGPATIVFSDRFELHPGLQASPNSAITAIECISISKDEKAKCIAKKLEYMGSISWKCVQANVIVVDKIEGYLKPFEKKIAEIISNINVINSSQNKWEAFRRLYYSSSDGSAE